ncbi:MAG TPA: hypothetical protein VLX91_16450 [Candidatus Acidoferrales bacterium]|nr:hypothetical protein [Candidatus Acidoferrales bacterium]
MRSIFQLLTGATEGYKFVESQNGAKYRTICKQCNEIMGSKYDTVINSFAISVGKYLRTALTLPPVLNHPTRPGALIRGILGHLIAVKVQHDQVAFDKNVAPAVLDESSPLPDDVFVYYWLYPYETSIVIRDLFISYVPLGVKGFFLCHLLKYFPVAYLVTDKPFFRSLPELTNYRALSPRDEVAIPIYLKSVMPLNWPETTDDCHVLLGGESLQNSVFAVPKRGKR